MENAWTKRIEELTESRDHWKREWSLLNAGLNMAEDRIKELEAENKRLAALNDMFPQEIARLEDRVSAEYEAERTDDRARIQELEAEVGRLMLMNPCNHTGFESAPCDICGYPDPRKLIARLKDERDADRRREYGYSQQTVDALTLERDKLRAERNDWKARYQSVSEMHDALIKEYNEGRAENKRLRELVDGAQEVVEISNFTFPAQREWKAAWLKKAAKALKEASRD